MLNPIFSLCIYVVEVIISYIFFSEIFEYRGFFAIRILIIGILAAIGSTVNLVFLNNSMLNGLTTFIITVLLALLCFRAKFTHGVFYATILTVINMALEVSIVFIGSVISGKNYLDYNSSFFLLIFEAATSKMLFFLVSLILVKVIHPQNTTTKIPIDFLTYPFTVTICQAIFWRVCSQPGISYQMQLLLSIASVCLFLSSILLFVTYSHQVQKDSQALQVKTQLERLQTEQSYYQILEQQNQQLMLYAHDTKKHLAAIQSLNEDPQIENYVAKLSRQLADYTHNCHSGNKLLDVMIHKYTIDCEMRGIQFEYDVKVCNLSQLEDIDLVAILGNLLDNAVTAAEKSVEKVISLNTAHRNSYSVIILSNSCDIPPKQSGSRLISTKSDASFHGYGLKSVEKSIHKYQGDYEWNFEAEKHLFTVTVMVADISR